MAATIAGVGVGLGLSCSAKLSQRASSSSSSGSYRCSLKMTASVEEKKKSFTLKKSEEAFNAAKVIGHLRFFHFLNICFRFDVMLLLICDVVGMI